MDWHNPAKENDRVARGGNWISNGKFELTSSARAPSAFSGRWDGTGFRVVLALPALQSPASAKIEDGASAFSNQAMLEQDLNKQRKLAESVLSKHGSVIVRRGSELLTVKRVEKLPPGPISLSDVDQVTGDFSDDDATLLKSCRELASLRIHRGSMTQLPLESLPDLERFEVSQCGITLPALRGLAGKPRLFQVHIGSTPVGGRIIDLLTTCPKLERLTLGLLGLTDSDLPPLGRIPRLRYLCLAEKSLTDTGLSVLTDFPVLDTVEFTWMDFTTVPLAFLPRMRTLSNVSFHWSRIAPPVCENLAKTPKLVTLTLHDCNIVHGSIRALAASTSLRSLSLSSSAITEASISELTVLTQLNGLDLSDTNITEEGVAALRKALPNCVVKR